MIAIRCMIGCPGFATLDAFGFSGPAAALVAARMLGSWLRRQPNSRSFVRRRNNARAYYTYRDSGGGAYHVVAGRAGRALGLHDACSPWGRIHRFRPRLGSRLFPPRDAGGQVAPMDGAGAAGRAGRGADGTH